MRWPRGIAVLAILFTSSTQAMDAAAFGVKQFPLRPTLIENNAPELCNAVLQSTLEAFRSDTTAPTVKAIKLDQLDWIRWADVPQVETSGDGRLYRLEADLDGTGKTQVILYRVVPFNWRFDWHLGFVAPSTVSAQALATLPSRADKEKVLDPSIRQFYQPGYVVNEPELIRWKNWIYLLDQYNRDSRDAPVPLTVSRLRADGSLEQKCVVDIPNRDAAIRTALARSSLSTFITNLHHIGGSGGGSCGSLHAEATHVSGAWAEARKTVTRPWALDRSKGRFYAEAGYFVYGPRMLEFLQSWSKASAWNRVVYLEMQQHMRRAQLRYTDWLRQEFGISHLDAASRAQVVMENLIAAWVLVPSGYQSGPASQYERQFVIGQPIIDRDLAQLESQLKNKSTFSVHLHDAVVWPRGLDALLRAGADVNARNFFGKTPLMMAAHLNRPDAVRVLLENQADVNARTERSTYECGYAIERGQRTALMYAAENAGIETVRLLLAAGADTAVKDSKGNGLEFYMRLNSRFTDVKSVQALVDLAKAPAGPITASFSCEGNTTSIEAAICKDETLRLYDRDIAESYGKLQKRNAPHIKTDQRAWLKERQMCQLPAAEATAGCLQDLMLARSRFLQSMTSEVIESRPPGP